MMDGFAVALTKLAQIPPVTKAGLKEYLLEYIIDSDLVSVYFCCWGIFLLNVLISVILVC